MYKRLSDAYDYSKYPCGLNGFGGVNPDEISYLTRRTAMRSRIGRGLAKAGFARLNNGDLIACPVYKSSDDNQLHCAFFRSTDGGKTWTQFETKGDSFSGSEHFLLVLNNAKILDCNGMRISLSEDSGVTWKTTMDFREKYKVDGEYSILGHNVLIDDDGSLVTFLSKGDYYDKSIERSQLWKVTSKDEGVTWELEETKSWERNIPMLWESFIFKLSDGSMIASSRAGSAHPIKGMPPPWPGVYGEEASCHTLLWRSYDNGYTWEGPEDFLDYGEVHASFTRLNDGKILCTYASYHIPFGIYAIVSNDNGRTWDKTHPVHLANSLNAFTGLPLSIQLPCGDIVTIYATMPYLESDNSSWFNPSNNDWVCEIVRWSSEL